MPKQNIYLDMVTASEAVSAAMEALDREQLIGVETVPVEEAYGRVTSAAVYARYSSPTFHSAAMDGIAVKAEKTFAAREDKPLLLKRGLDYQVVNTGHPLPPGMDAVIMVENLVQVDGNTVQIEAPAFPWSHVRRIGEDIVATELILPRNHTLSPYDVGALLSGGIWEVKVRERVRMVFIPTGNEVLDFKDRPKPGPGEVIESNSQVFASLAKKNGFVVTRVPPVPDEPELLVKAVRQGLDSNAHIVAVGAGSSAGTKDFTAQVFNELGRVLVHGISVMPGKPTILGKAQGKLLVGVPGYPVGAVICYEDVVAPIAAWLERKIPPERKNVPVALARKTPSKLGLEEIVRLAVGRVGNRYVAAPLPRGAGMITTLTRAQAVTRIPAHCEGVEQNEVVSAELLVPQSALDKVLIHVGSHDNTLDLIADELMGLPDPLRLVSSHVGSMGGLTALKSGSALFAGAHLFDPETNDFNFPFIEKYLPGFNLVAVNLVIRHQGLIVQKGNPRGIDGIEDLAREDVSFINRQRGAGTRILLDYHLDQAGLDPKKVKGYGREEYTHMAVAVNVLTGSADCGLGIFAAAKALGLDFVPVARERYDLLIPAKNMDDPKMEVLLKLINGKKFKKKAGALGGYETGLTGQIMKPGLGLG